MALQESNDNSRTGHHCRDCGLFFESSKSLDVHLQYHKENLLTKWANQANAAIDSTRTDSDNNNVKSRREFQNLVAAPADSTDMKPVLPTGPGRPSSNSGYPPASSPFTHPHTPASYSSAPSPYQNDIQRFSPSNNPGPSPSSTSFGYSNGTAEPAYQLPFNNYPGNMRSPRSQSSGDPSQQFFSETPQESPYMMGANNDFPGGGPPPTGAPTTGQRSNSPSSSSAFRFGMFNKNCYPLDKNGVSSSSPNSFRPQSPFQCEKCGFICESSSTLADHVKTVHAPSPMVYNHGSNVFQPSDTFFRPEVVKPEVIQDSPDILDLDSQQKVFRSPEEESGSVTPVSNPHSVSAMLTPWPGNHVKPQYSQTQPYLVTSTNPPPPQTYQPQNGPVPNSGNYQPRNFPSDTFPQQSNVPNQSINNNQIPNSASPKLTNPTTNSLPHSGISAAKGDSWKSNEARRPKTYNCSACNKWFTSSGHLKRHYNTTLHKNAVKQSGQPDPATLPISSHHHPNRDPNYIHSSKTPAGMANPPPNLSAVTKAKKAKSISPQGDANTPSPALSNANEGDSSRSNDNIYDRMYDRNGTMPNGTYERPVQHGFGNAGFDMMQSSQTSAFERTTPGGGPGSAFDQRTTPQGFDQRSTPQGFERPQAFDGRTAEYDGRGQPNGYGIQDLNRPGSNSDLPASQNYEYYRYDRLPLHNQQNSTNQVAAQSPNFQAGPSVSPSGGLPICPPLHPSLRTPNHMNTFMGENILMVPASDLPSQPQDHLIIPQYINSPIIIGNSESLQNAPLPSFSNFQTSIFQQNFQSGSPYEKGFYTSPGNSSQVYTSFVKSDLPDDQEKMVYIPEYLDEGPIKSDVEKECFLPYVKQRHLELLNIKMELDNMSEGPESPMQPTSPVEFPTSTNLELAEPVKLRVKKTKKQKRKSEESSNVVTSTGSPQPVVKKAVIKCEECDKYFNRICYLTQHNKSFHSGEKPFKCDHCGKRFHSEVRARDHSKKHGGEKPYKCEMCPKSFNHKTDLRRHLCLHSGEKPYACEHCGKGFIRKDHMLKHVETHRNGKRKFMNKVVDDLLEAKTKLAETG
ncbi:hypothetical protein RUM43_008205 [Polyplax serrata]|uniref:C2H2-type domain-containing protein n=1 Tax=Polyplax serrata TaxID=468196 RepID=A0AAN8Q6W4_POLSC